LPRIRNLLVANRGEIALRVMRTARALGYRTTAVYSEADAASPHVAYADAAVAIGPAQVGASYLNGARIVQAARGAGADAVHPGYGLLSENAGFARACAQAGLLFVGPRPETIELMGDKRRARLAVQAAGVACVPGYDGELQDDATLQAEAVRIGFPLMVKAAAGGGGRGMRRVLSPDRLAEAIARARSEAQKAFGDDRLILERAIDGARHVEVQVFGDQHGRVIHLFERDCSLQRRFQKIVEEAPAPGVDDALRRRLGEVAVRAAQSAGYVGAGTVELLLDREGEFYFLEMNTRLQVEHAVTELLTGLDLVEWQLRVAQGEPLPLLQEQVALRGHAIEARLCAERPERGFLPATGRVLRLRVPEGVRVDHALRPGLPVEAHYDSLLAKLVAHGEDRETARRKLCAALDALCLLGVRTNQAFLRDVLDHPRFIASTVTTDWLESEQVAARSVGRPIPASSWSAAAAAWFVRAGVEARYPAELAGFSNCAGLRWPLTLACDGERRELAIVQERSGALVVEMGDELVTAPQAAEAPDALTLVAGGVHRRFELAWDGERLWLAEPGGVARVFTSPPRTARGAEARGSGRAAAPMDGVAADVLVRPGDRVRRGQTVVVIEAMKLELQVTADVEGVVAAVHVQRGQQVKARQLLVEVRSAEASTAEEAQPT
jgi:geranyl-CoA carboxylase alpha subunit